MSYDIETAFYEFIKKDCDPYGVREYREKYGPLSLRQIEWLLVAPSADGPFCIYPDPLIESLHQWGCKEP